MFSFTKKFSAKTKIKNAHYTQRQNQSTKSNLKSFAKSKTHKIHKNFIQSFRDSLGFFYLLKRHANRRKKSDSLSLHEIVHIAGHKSMYLLILIFNLPTIFPIPLPPGMSVLGTVPCILVAGHLVFGKKELMLPKKLLSVSIKKNFLIKLTDAFHHSLFKFSKVFKKRMPILFTDSSLRLIGAYIIFMSIVLLLPIPFTNLAVGMSIVLVALGLLIEDGLFIILGFVWGFFALLFCIFLILLGKALMIKLLSHFGIHIFGA